MRTENKNIIINPKGKTKDIVNEVMNTYYLYRNNCNEFAEQFRRDSIEDTCLAIFDYIIDNIDYKEDPNGVQWIKTPARLLKDGIGDCKSMSIFIASMLYCLDIDCFFRFVSFRKNSKQVTHVYIITESGVIIDPVERVNNQPIFNYAQAFTYNIDMHTTEISRLSGTPSDFKIWTDNSWMLDNTIASNYIYTQLDLVDAEIGIKPNDSTLYLQRDIYKVALALYNRSKGYESLMIRAGAVLQHLVDIGVIASNATATSKAISIDTIIDNALSYLLDINQTLPTDGPYIEWWNLKIASYDYNSLTETNRREYLASRNIAIGATSEELNAVFSEMQASSPYFLYYLIDENWVRANKQKYPMVYKKFFTQKNLFTSWVIATKQYTNEETLLNNLRSGFIKRTGKTPEDFFAMALDANSPKVGLAASVIAAIITGVVAIITSVIYAVSNIIQANVQSPDNWPDSAPSDYDLSAEDFAGTNLGENGSSSNGFFSGENKYTNFLALGAVALAIYKFSKSK